MLKTFLTFILVVTIGSALLAHTPTPTPAVRQYTCVMHPEVAQDHPGKCPKCGMELVPVKTESKHPTPNIQHPMSKVRAVNSTASTARESTHHGHAQHDHAMHEMKMQSSVNLTDPMTREGSGT